MLFPTNWELSTKRATNVVLFLVDECGVDPVKLTATGNGEFRPIALTIRKRTGKKTED